MIGLRRDKAELGQVKSMSTFLGKNLGLVPFWIHWDPPKKTVRKEYVSYNFFREVNRGRPILFNRLFLTDTDTDLFSITDTDI